MLKLFKLFFTNKLCSQSRTDVFFSITGFLFLVTALGVLSLIVIPSVGDYFTILFFGGISSIICLVSLLSAKREQEHHEHQIQKTEKAEADPFYKKITNATNTLSSKSYYIEKYSENLEEFDMVISAGDCIIGINSSKEAGDLRASFSVSYFDTLNKKEINPDSEVCEELNKKLKSLSVKILKDHINGNKSKSVFQKAIEMYEEQSDEPDHRKESSNNFNLLTQKKGTL